VGSLPGMGKSSLLVRCDTRREYFARSSHVPGFVRWLATANSEILRETTHRGNLLRNVLGIWCGTEIMFGQKLCQ
jgi:hypothetical protein